MSISFDAAWGNEDTQQLIDILKKYQVTATFFVVGEWVDKYPESVKALHDAGREIINHSNTHAHYPQLSAEEVVADLNACNDKIEAVTGVRPTLVRLPCLLQEGYTFVPISQIILDGEYTIDHTGRQCPAGQG